MSQIASDAKIQSAMTKLGMTAPLTNMDDSQVLKAILVALGNVTGGGGGGGSGTVTSVSFTGGLISVATATTTPALTVAGTSGGIPYFSSASTWASSGVLAANALLVGGGAGAAPSSVTTGTGVLTALGVNVGSAGAFVVNGGALGTPSSGVLSSCTGLPASTGITGTLAAANGGTGVANGAACTLTLPNAATTITTGGTLALGGFTLTVPATGTAGLLGTNNSWSVAQYFAAGSSGAPAIAMASSTNSGFYTVGVSTWGVAAGGSAIMCWGPLDGAQLKSTSPLSWSSGGLNSTSDVFLYRKAAATLQLGQDAAGVTNQVLTSANRITSDGVGSNLTIAAGNGRGGAGGTLILSTFDTAGAGTAGTLRSRMTIDTAGAVAFPVVTAVTTETVVSDTTWPITINGVAYKVLLRA